MKLKFNFRLLISMLVFSIPVACFLTPDRQSARERDLIQLHISDFHQNLFIEFGGESYSESELPEIFERMFTNGDLFCDMIYRRRALQKVDAYKFLRPASFKTFWPRRNREYINKLIVGCYNFFRMNDIRPFKDFKLVKALYPESSFDCFSVGLMQPYIMHNIMDCQTLQMLDIDWRIMAAHHQLLQFYQSGQMSTRVQALKKIKDLRFGWIAFYPNGMRKRNPVSLNSLCTFNTELCLQNLINFQRKVGSLESVRLNLSALHDGAYQRADPAGMQVVYLSNAIEEVYTSRKQFAQLLDRTTAARITTGHTLFVYHAAGTAGLGLYDVSGEPGAESIKTICKDVYKRRVEEELQIYTTYFEKITSTAKPTSCYKLLRKYKIN